MKKWFNWICLFGFLTLAWTNPSLNEDGTICTDLAGIKFKVLQVSTGNRYEVYFPLFYEEDGDTTWHAREGEEMTGLHFALPPGAAPYDYYWITAFAVDFSSNDSDSSNTISVNASDYDQ